MLLEELFLSFRLVQKQISGPVRRRQSSEGFLQVVVFLEALDELLQLFLSSFDWSKPAEKRQESDVETHSGLKATAQTGCFGEPGVHLVCLKAQVGIQDQTRREIIVLTQLLGSHS